MKKKLLAITLGLALAMAGLTGCGSDTGAGASLSSETVETVASSASTEEASQETAVESSDVVESTAVESSATEEPEKVLVQKDYEEIYAGLIEQFCDAIIQDVEDEADAPEGYFWGVKERVMYAEGNPLDLITYSVHDINGDSARELIISSTDDDGVLAMYTYVDGEIKFVMGGMTRNRYTLIQNGVVFNQGSNGAASSGFGYYTLNGKTGELEITEQFFTDSIDDNGTIGVFHNTTGDWDKNKSEQLDISADLLWVTELASAGQVITFTKHPLSEVKYVEIGTAKDATMDVYYVEDYELPEEYYTAICDSGEYSCSMVIVPSERVVDLTVDGLTYQDIDENGNILFEKEDYFTFEEVTPDHPLLIQATLVGSIPNLGVSYTAADGSRVCYAICESGMDGSLYLTQY